MQWPTEILVGRFLLDIGNNNHNTDKDREAMIHKY